MEGNGVLQTTKGLETPIVNNFLILGSQEAVFEKHSAPPIPDRILLYINLLSTEWPIECRLSGFCRKDPFSPCQHRYQKYP
jgi:hypothetical protein